MIYDWTEKMAISLKVIIFLMTACVNLWPVSGSKSMTCSNHQVPVIAHPGLSVTFNCSYPAAQKNIIKTFCKKMMTRDGNTTCTNLISTTTASLTKTSRFSMQDDKQLRVYNVTISALTKDDSGKYQCATERLEDGATTCLTEISLNVSNWDTIWPTAVSGHPGETIRIRCNYPDSHESNEKFLCKGKSPIGCEKLIRTTEQNRVVAEGRFDIRDNKRLKYFYVNIKDAITADSGTYWCGSDRTWQHTRTRVVVTVASTAGHVRKGDPTGAEYDNKDEHGKPNKNSYHLKPGEIVGVVIGLASPLVLVLVLLLCRDKLPRSLGCRREADLSENEDENTVTEPDKEQGDSQYAEIQMPNQQPSSGTAVSTVYATVKYDPQP